MIRSVFDWNSGLYHYFEGVGEGLGVRPQGKEINDPNGRGHKIEELLPVIPVGSRHVGRGEEARGRVAMLNPEMREQLKDVGGDGGEAVRNFVGFNDGFGDDTGNPIVDSPWLTLGLWMGAVYGLYQLAVAAGRHVAGTK